MYSECTVKERKAIHAPSIRLLALAYYWCRCGRAAAAAKANAEQDPDRVCLCGRSLERAARGRRRRTPHQRTGIETDPAFSPDGTRIAFTGEYDGNVDVFVIPAAGGVPKRLTWHPAADRVLGWTPDGKRIIFSSTRTAYSRFGEMFTRPGRGRRGREAAAPERIRGVHVARTASRSRTSPPGRHSRCGRDIAAGRPRASGSRSLSDSSVTKVPRTNSNDFNPMWAGDRVYFLSDRNGPATLFYYDTKTKAVREAIPNKGLDLKSASLGPDAIVYEQFGGISLYDLKSGKTKPVRFACRAIFRNCAPGWSTSGGG